MPEITMPQLGETVTEGTITRWAKEVGDIVAEGEVIFEVSTDKVDSEVPSPVSGVLSEILVPVGETVDVGTSLAAIVAEGEDRTASSAGPPTTVPPESAGITGGSEPAERDSARREKRHRATGATVPDGLFGRVLSPIVRRLITEHNLDPGQIVGTGAGGRITRSDIETVIRCDDSMSAAPAALPTPHPEAATGATAVPTPGAPPVPSFLAPSTGERDEIVPLSNIRRRTAEHMVRSKRTSAHTMVAVEVDYLGVEKVRAGAKDSFRQAEGFGLTYLPFVTRAVVDALEAFPHVNSSVHDDALVVHRDRNIGIAVDLDFEGLLVPVVRQADEKRLRALARDISRLAAKARSKRLTMDDISGGTLTITNTGPFGSLLTIPLINQPQVAIVCSDGVKKRPVVVELPDGTDAIGIHPVGNLVLSWDHRAFDGAYAASFLGTVKEIIETRDWAAEL